MLRISGLKIPVTEELTEELLKTAVEKKLKTTGVKHIKMIRLSIDARDRSRVTYNLTLDFDVKGEKRFLSRKNISKPQYQHYSLPQCPDKTITPIVVGFGPAGMFCGLALAEMGLSPVILERGKCVEERKKDIEKFRNTADFDPKSNVQFGEGGAGTFSDGKLTTGINDVRCAYILKRFVEFGAPPCIEYLAKPHIGTDNLVNIVRNIRKRIESLGGKVLFEHKLTDIEFENTTPVSVTAETPNGLKNFACNRVVLAIGHSARDTFEMLYNTGFAMEQKPFAMGVRIEHLQKDINYAQYGDFAKYLPAADYKLTAHLPNGHTAYSFCMCPGGYVVAAASEVGRLVTNGMSYFSRAGENANSALLVNIGTEDFCGNHPLDGVKFQRELEERAFKAGGGDYSAPAQKVGDLLNDRKTTEFGKVEPSYRPSVTPSDMREIFPDFMYTSLKSGIVEMDKKLKGFADKDAVVTAVESRSSSPVRILRNKGSLESLNFSGIYPCGEGCGYAGGIMSAAADGLRVAEEIAAVWHKMRLFPEPFDRMKNGSKTVELRLNDEKRRLLRVGDRIEFTNTQNGEKLSVKIIGLHKFPTFKELYDKLDPIECGYTHENVKNASPADMDEFYSPEKQLQYGVLAIRVAVIR